MRSRTPERMHSMSSCFSELNCLNSKKGEQPKRVEIEDAGEDAFEFMFQGEQEHKLNAPTPDPGTHPGTCKHLSLFKSVFVSFAQRYGTKVQVLEKNLKERFFVYSRATAGSLTGSECFTAGYCAQPAVNSCHCRFDGIPPIFLARPRLNRQWGWFNAGSRRTGTDEPALMTSSVVVLRAERSNDNV